MNSFNQPLGQFQPNCGNYQTTGQVYQQQQQQQQQQQSVAASAVATNTSLVAMQQFASQSAANFVPFQQNYSVNCLQKEIDSLKKQNNELQREIEKLRSAYTDCNYQIMASNMKLNNFQEQVEQLCKEKIDQEKAYKELKLKYDEKFALFRIPHQSDERSLFCDECNFEVKSQVALFIHKLNHHFESSIPRHLQLSTRSFSTMPDDSIRFKYKCHCCEIDSSREFARHEIYVHIYQFHTFDTPFKCKFCFLYFTSKSYLNDHLMEKHSLPNRQGKNKRKSIEPKCESDQLNSTLNLNSKSHPNHRSSSSLLVKRIKNSDQESNASPSDINDLFQQLVGESLTDPETALAAVSSTGNLHHHQHNLHNNVGGTTNNIINSNTNSNSQQNSLPIKSESKMSNSNTSTPAATRDNEIQQIMNDLDCVDNLNCKYPGCKFIATTKNHLKFHISAHLMSKYKCPYCTFVGNRIVEIKRHILKSSKHTDQHVFLCPDCDFASDCEKTFRDHYGRYHNSATDITLVIEKLFLNESNMVSQNMLSAFGNKNST